MFNFPNLWHIGPLAITLSARKILMVLLPVCVIYMKLLMLTLNMNEKDIHLLWNAFTVNMSSMYMHPRMLSTERTIKTIILKISIIYPLSTIIPKIALNDRIIRLIKLPWSSSLACAGIETSSSYQFPRQVIILCHKCSTRWIHRTDCDTEKQLLFEGGIRSASVLEWLH